MTQGRSAPRRDTTGRKPRTAAQGSAPRSRSPLPSRTRTSALVAIVSDIHFDLHDKACWAAFRLWHTAHRPATTVILGDFLDFGMLSRYIQEADAPVKAIPQIECFVREANALAAECGELVVVEGNHDERWAKALGANPIALDGAIGLSLYDQCLAHGLDEDVTWSREDVRYRGRKVGPFVLRHGHNQAGRFGSPVHLAANRLTRSLGVSEVFGHHHKAQLFARTAHGRTAIAIANPCMTRAHSYAPDADWQRGFTIIECDPEDATMATAYPIIMHESGRFAWAGTVYDGAAALRQARAKRDRDRARRRGERA